MINLRSNITNNKRLLLEGRDGSYKQQKALLMYWHKDSIPKEPRIEKIAIEMPEKKRSEIVKRPNWQAVGTSECQTPSHQVTREKPQCRTQEEEE